MLLHINLKYVVLLVGFLIYGIMVLVLLRLCVKYPKLRELVIQSFQDSSNPSGSKKVSGKSLTAAFLVHIVGFAAIMAVVYSKDHALPPYFLDALLLFIAALYGINKIPTKGGGFIDTNTNQQEQILEPQEVKKDKVKNKEEKLDSDGRKIIDNPDA